MDFHSDADDFDSLISEDSFDSLSAPFVDSPIMVTIFPDHRAQSRTERQMTLGQLAAEIASSAPRHKADLPDYQLASFSGARTDNNCLRSNDAVVSVAGIRSDSDNAVISFEEAGRRVRAAGIGALVYTTSSHLKPGKGQRYRVFAPFSRDLPPDSYVPMMARLSGILDGDIDPHSFTISQPMYSGNTTDGHPLQSVVIEGRSIDLADELDARALHKGQRRLPDGAVIGGPLSRSDRPGSDILDFARGELESVLAEIPVDVIEDRPFWLDIGMALHHQFSGSDEGFQLWMETSRRGANYLEGSSERKERRRYDGFGRGAGRRRPMTMGSVLQWAPVAAEARRLRLFDTMVEDFKAEIPDLAPLPVTRDDERRAAQKLENERLQESLPFSVLPPKMSLEEMVDDCVWIAEGSQVGRMSNPRQLLTYREFADLTAASVSFKITGTDVKKKQSVANAQRWKSSPARKTVDTRTFHPGADVLCQDADGKPALNSWRPIDRRPATRDIDPFLGQLAYLFPDAAERDAFLDWLAHVDQCPGVLPHFGWLHVAANTGTGRNWLASVLSRVWRGYVAPNVDLPALLDSQFNGPLAGRILAIVDEVQEGAGENPYRHQNKLKSLVNAEYRDINPKFGRQYREHNACRWLVFSNHDNALPLNDTDRRWRVVRHDAAPRSPGDYASLYGLLSDDEFINAVGVYLRERDITGFNPGARPPMTAAKRAAVTASKTLVQRYAEDLATSHEADVITNADAARFLSDGGPATAITPAMRRALEEAGAVSIDRTLRVHGRTQRAWILRNHEKWITADASAVVAEASRLWLGGNPDQEPF